METTRGPDLSTDVLVIGGGGAGLRAAIEAAAGGVRVLMVAKGRVGYSCNTGISGGGLAASIGRASSPDTHEMHLKDTLLAGRFINDRTLVEEVVRGIPQQVEALISFGAAFLRGGAVQGRAGAILQGIGDAQPSLGVGAGVGHGVYGGPADRGLPCGSVDFVQCPSQKTQGGGGLG